MIAQFNLAVMLENGQGGAKDIKQAILWYKKAASQGDGPAMFNLGNLYWNSVGDRAIARRWWKKAVRAGIHDAQTNLDLTE
ncbi:sel1 repeat family protein [bacterium]|nr:sel1 repeat family protein [bacterium]